MLVQRTILIGAVALVAASGFLALASGHSAARADGDAVVGEAIAVIVCPDGTEVEYNPAEVSDPEDLCPSIIGEPLAVIVCPDGTAVEYNPADVSDPEELCPSVIGEAIAVIVCPDGTEVEYNPAEVIDPYELCSRLGSGPPADFECPDGTVVGYAPHEIDDPSTLCPDGDRRGEEPRREPERHRDAVDIDCDHPQWPRNADEFLACDHGEVPEDDAGDPDGKILLPPKTGTAAFTGGNGAAFGALLAIVAGGALAGSLLVRR